MNPTFLIVTTQRERHEIRLNTADGPRFTLVLSSGYTLEFAGSPSGGLNISTPQGLYGIAVLPKGERRIEILPADTVYDQLTFKK